MLKLVVSSQGRLNQTYILSNIAQFDKNYSWIFFLEFYKKNGLNLTRHQTFVVFKVHINCDI